MGQEYVHHLIAGIPCKTLHKTYLLYSYKYDTEYGRILRNQHHTQHIKKMFVFLVNSSYMPQVHILQQ